MADRYDLKTARKGKDGKTYWTKIGVMFPMRDRDGFSISLEALPIPTLNDSGGLECRIMAWEPYDKDRADGADAKPRRQSDLDDKVPF